MNALNKICRIYTVLTLVALGIVSFTGLPGQIKYEWRVSNQSQEITQAQDDAIKMAALLPPQEKPKVKK